MLRLLFRLWWLQQRRSFTWKDAVVGGYLIFVYVMVGLGFYFGATLDGEELFEDGTPDALCAILVLTMLVPDIILKVVMKHDSTAMDDYLKSRPVPEKVWNRFLLLTNLAKTSETGRLLLVLIINLQVIEVEKQAGDDEHSPYSHTDVDQESRHPGETYKIGSKDGSHTYPAQQQGPAQHPVGSFIIASDINASSASDLSN